MRDTLDLKTPSISEKFKKPRTLGKLIFIPKVAEFQNSFWSAGHSVYDSLSLGAIAAFTVRFFSTCRFLYTARFVKLREKLKKTSINTKILTTITQARIFFSNETKLPQLNSIFYMSNDVKHVERHESAPYLRLKKSTRASKFQVFFYSTRKKTQKLDRIDGSEVLF